MAQGRLAAHDAMDGTVMGWHVVVAACPLCSSSHDFPAGKAASQVEGMKQANCGRGKLMVRLAAGEMAGARKHALGRQFAAEQEARKRAAWSVEAHRLLDKDLANGR